MSELQTDNESTPNELITQEDVQTDSGTVESGSDLATDTGENQEKINQDAVNKAINKQHALKQAERREKEAAQAELAEARKKLAEFEASKPALSIPPIPDPYDDDFEEKTKARDAAIIAKANQDAQQNLLASQQQATQQQAEQAKQAERNKATEAYKKRATDLGITPDQLQASANTIINNGIKDSVAEFILQDQDGPLIVQYLAANPIEQDELNSMTSMQAAVAISSTIKQKASALKPRTSNAPDPVRPLGGNGVDPDMGKHPFSKGATFS